MKNPEKDLTGPENQQWDAIYKREGRVFNEVQENMPEVVELLKERGVGAVLDLGCGTGRHSAYLAENGMRVSGMDASPEGVRQTQERMESEGLGGDFRAGNIYDKLPYPDASFGAIVSTQTLHHNTIENIRTLIEEMKRVLTPDGIIFITVTRGKEGSKGGKDTDIEIAPHTFAPTEGTEKGLAHYYFDEKRLEEEFGDFQAKVWIEKGGRHLCLLGERKEQTEK